MPEVAREAPTRQDTWNIGVHVNGENFGLWDKKTGGELDSDSTTYYPGGMRDQIDLGGRKTAGNLTLQRLYDRVDDHERIGRLLAGVGRAKVNVHQRPLDFDANPSARAINWNGRLKRVQVPDVDSESSTAALIEIEVTIKGYPTLI
jgi:hypothetical protein